jgi:hypothetical protein
MPIRLTEYRIRVKREAASIEEIIPDTWFANSQDAEHFADVYAGCFRAKILSIEQGTKTKVNFEKDFDKNGYPLNMKW